MRRLMVGRAMFVSVLAAALLVVLQAAGAGLAAAARPQAAALRTSVHLVYRGTVNLRAVAGGQGMGSAAAPGRYPAGRILPVYVRSAAPATVPAPNPSPTKVVANPGGAQGFVGLTAADSATVNGVDGEPPDQGLCAHGGAVMEPVNLALRVYTESGISLAPAISLSAFFGLPPVVSTFGGHTSYGPLLSDPRCYYDAQTGRWFVTVVEIDLNPYTGDFGYRSSELIAVSQTSDPTGTYSLFSFDTTNDGTDGTPAEPHCPCFGDQPRIGADANGFYMSTDSRPIPHGPERFNSNGGEVYAGSKQGLAAAATGTVPPPTLVSIHIGAVTIDGNPANGVQPAQTPEGGPYANDREYLMSTPDFNLFATMRETGARAIVLWTLSNTSTLANPSPSVTLTDSVLPSEPFAPPVNAKQQSGPLPLGDAVKSPLAPLNVDDDRMQQVEYTGGQLYSSLETGVGPNGTANRTGAAWFVVTPSGNGGVVSHQGYVAIGNGASVLYPAIGLDKTRKGVMTFSISGPTYHPSAAYMMFGASAPAPPIHVTAPGISPEDGYTCYAPFGGPPCRWGDYSAASSDGSGKIVMGDEMIANTVRDQLANWGTFLGVVTP